MSSMIRRAMVLAAGLGLRMRPLSETLPKPLIRLAGRPLIDHVLDRLQAAGVERVVVNTHYLADQLEAHLAGRGTPAIEVSREPALLDTGGGVVHALARFEREPFYIVNADSFWLDGTTDSLKRLARFWDPVGMGAALLLHRTVTAIGYEGEGDYFSDQVGRLRRRRAETVAPLAYAGVAIANADTFAGRTAGAFSLRDVWDALEEQERLFGQVHDGLWFHVGRPDDLQAGEQVLAERRIVVGT